MTLKLRCLRLNRLSDEKDVRKDVLGGVNRRYKSIIASLV